MRRLIIALLAFALGQLILLGQTYQDAFERARSLVKQKQFAEALEQARQAVHLDNTRWEGWFVEGTAAVGLEKYDLAIDYFEEALSRAPDQAKSSVNDAIASCRQALAARSAAPNRVTAPPPSYAPPPRPPVDYPSVPAAAGAPRTGLAPGTWLFCITNSKSPLQNDGTEGKCLQGGFILALAPEGGVTGVSPKGGFWTYPTSGRWSLEGDRTLVEITMETDLDSGTWFTKFTIAGASQSDAQFFQMSSRKGNSKKEDQASGTLLRVNEATLQRCLPLGKTRTQLGLENQKNFNQCMSGAVAKAGR